VRHFAIFLAIAPSPSANLRRIARRIAKDTLFAKYVGQWHDGVTDISCPPGLKLLTAPSLSDPMRGLDTLQGDLLCWRALLCPFNKYVGQWHDGVTDISRPPGLKLLTARSLSDPMRGLDTLQGDLLCWRALLCLPWPLGQGALKV